MRFGQKNVIFGSADGKGWETQTMKQKEWNFLVYIWLSNEVLRSSKSNFIGYSNLMKKRGEKMVATSN